MAVLGLDVFKRPLACKIVANEFGAEPHATLVAIVQFLIAECAQRAVLIAHAPDGQSNAQQLAETANELNAMLFAFDVEVVDAIQTQAHGDAQSLHELGLFKPKEMGMKVLDLLSSRKRRSETEQQTDSTMLATIIRKAAADQDLTTGERALLERKLDNGELTDEELQKQIETRRRVDRKIAVLAEAIRRDRIRRPEYEAAMASLPELEKRVGAVARDHCARLRLGLGRSAYCCNLH